MNAAGLLKKSKIILAGGASRILASFVNVIVSFVIIRTQSPALWGEVVYYILFLDFGFSIIAWGATPYLVREFSQHPKHMGNALAQSISSRCLILIIFLLINAFLPVPGTLKLFLGLWAVSRFIYHSFEPIVQFERNFLFSLFVELVAIGVIVVPMFLWVDLTAERTVQLFSIGAMWRALAFVFFYRSRIRFTRPSLNFFLGAFPFLLLTFSAMLQQRADLYSVAYFLNDRDTGTYQIFINLLIFAQFLSSLLLSPFAKNIFRLPLRAFLKLERRFMLAGIALSALSTFGVYFLIHYLYRLEIPLVMYPLGYFYILTFYLYALRNYDLGKSGKQMLVAVYSFAGSAINLSLSIFLIPAFGLEGALTASTFSQVFIVFLYHYKNMFSNAKG